MNQDVYSHIVSYLKIIDTPIISRNFIKGYVMKKLQRLNGIPVLVDILWHSPGFCHKYCICGVVGEKERLEYYKTKRLIS
jgi:hypothetical protein